MPVWAPGGPGDAGEHVAFRGRLALEDDGDVELRILAASSFVAYLDGEFLLEGPSRFGPTRPEHESLRMHVSRGEHVLAVHVVHHGVPTEVLPELPPFLWARTFTGSDTVDISWRCMRLGAYATGGRRVNPNLGWAERCDTRELPDWTVPRLDDTEWETPAPVDSLGAQPVPVSLGQLRHQWWSAELVGEGIWQDRFHLFEDDPPTCFALRDLNPSQAAAQGSWWRFDLGRVRLGRPEVDLEVPPGTCVEMAYGESLYDGRVLPWISWSNGLSCNLDAYVARGGPQVFGPVSPRGGRYLEVHVGAPVDQVVVRRAGMLERSAYPEEPVGRLQCDDTMLERIWRTGWDTLRACAEDAVTDCPTRERGQWVGDIVVGMEIAAVAHGDLRIFRRGLVQSADAADETGLVSGNAPGMCLQLATYAASWVSACVRYVELTGDRSLLEQLWPAAQRTLEVFRKATTPHGVTDGLPWPFVDWGYVRPDAPADMAVSLWVLAAARDGARWAELVGEPGHDLAAWAGELELVVRGWLGGVEGWEQVGFHCTSLALLRGVVDDPDVPTALGFLKGHILGCFPNDPDAPRLDSIHVAESRLITPYFGHYALDALARAGEVDFMLQQHRACWGWMLEQGATTWWEVFDPGWSRCHQWSGAPTWQLSRNLLGLLPRYDRGPLHYGLALNPGSLARARGRVPLPHPHDGWIDVSWERQANDSIRISLASTTPITVEVEGQDVLVVGEWTGVLG